MRLLAFGVLGMVLMAALGVIVAWSGDETTANDIWSLLLLLPIALVLMPPALLPIAFVVGMATGISLVAVQQTLAMARHYWRGVIGVALLATSALAVIPVARNLIAPN